VLVADDDPLIVATLFRPPFRSCFCPPKAAVNHIVGRVLLLADLVAQIVATLQVGSPVPMRLTVEADRWQPTALSQQEAVPIAIAIGELCMNALKHTRNVPGAHVMGSVAHTAAGVELNISNSPAQLPRGFQLSDRATASAGLDLVRALLPRGTSSLQIEQHGDTVVTRLLFRSAQPPTNPPTESGPAARLHTIMSRCSFASAFSSAAALPARGLMSCAARVALGPRPLPAADLAAMAPPGRMDVAHIVFQRLLLKQRLIY
jgi:hypothetical protein